MGKFFFFFILITTTSCSQNKAPGNSSTFLAGKQLAELTNDRLLEPSGLAASANNPGLLWTHNDSGNPAEIFLVDEKLDIKLVCTLQGATNRDWEDIAVGPGPKPGKNYIYVGEIGDNFAVYPYKAIYRFEEPKMKAGVKEILISSFEKIIFKLEDGKKDTEALLVHPQTKNIYIISKREQPVHLYELKYPYSTGDTLIATKLISLPFTMIVAGDFSADGKEVLIKNYQQIFYWYLDKKPLTETLQKEPKIITYKPEPQGEAITFARDGSGFFTLSEKVKEEKSYLYFYPRKQ